LLSTIFLGFFCLSYSKFGWSASLTFMFAFFCPVWCYLESCISLPLSYPLGPGRHLQLRLRQHEPCNPCGHAGNMPSKSSGGIEFYSKTSGILGSPYLP
jgi:hypothetical protein